MTSIAQRVHPGLKEKVPILSESWQEKSVTVSYIFMSCRVLERARIKHNINIQELQDVELYICASH
jgi:hypothetical protein